MNCKFNNIKKQVKKYLDLYYKRTDSIVFQGELNDSTGLIKMNTKIETDITFDIKNTGNSNARIIA
ncbi:MAG: hypothetical protein KAT68_00425 [Bacteroidales bacterium]|nr:hypothetical protein [Bacteroidales bacterium]